MTNIRIKFAAANQRRAMAGRGEQQPARHCNPFNRAGTYDSKTTGEYQLSLYCTEENMPEARQHLTERIQSSGLANRVNIIYHQIKPIEYGVNPLTDADCRTYIQVRSPRGEEVFQTSDVLKRTGHGNFKNYVATVLGAVQKDIEKEI